MKVVLNNMVDFHCLETVVDDFLTTACAKIIMEDISDGVLSDVDDTDSPVMVDADDDVEDDNGEWHEDLEKALAEDFVDQAMIKSVCQCRSLPIVYRYLNGYACVKPYIPKFPFCVYVCVQTF